MFSGSTRPALALDRVVKRFATYTAVEDVTMDVEAGTFVSIVGPSGCGKSTLLNVIAGLLAPSGGSVEVFGKFACDLFNQPILNPGGLNGQPG